MVIKNYSLSLVRIDWDGVRHAFLDANVSNPHTTNGKPKINQLGVELH
jgi:hypothetical protein